MFNVHAMHGMFCHFIQPIRKKVEADDGNYFLPINVTTNNEVAVCESMLELGLRQLSNFGNEAGNVLDLIFTNKHNDISVFESTRPMLKLDRWHVAIEMELSIEDYEQAEDSADSYEIYLYDLADFVAINESIGSNMTLARIEHIQSLDSAFGALYKVLEETVEKFVQKKTVQKTNDPPWYNKELKHLKNIKNKKYKKCKRLDNFEPYNAASDAFTRLQKTLYARYIARIHSQIKRNPKYFWNFVNERRKQNNGIPSVVECGNVSAKTDIDKAELFADFFVDQYVACEEIDIDNIVNECRGESLRKAIAEEDVLKVLKSMKTNKGPGPDGIAPKLLKN